ncbi:GTPase HflX [Tepidiforma flava]|uniref:GTPase HflX n=1 Tax=Tepidiforma flava TaxID=3004094 RepID=UPI00357129B2
MEGAIGTRGPGETQIETDRRLIRNRIAKIRRDLEEVRTQRELYRRRRARNNVPVVALVGYTNAGKSTLMRALSGADVLAEDRLFATLDPVTRRISLPSGEVVLLTDTVGFIQKLPTGLVAAFRATLEELEDADLLLHVVDIAHPNAYQHVQTVEATLRDLGVHESPS